MADNSEFIKYKLKDFDLIHSRASRLNRILKNRKGALLGAAIILALVGSIIAFGLLVVVTSSAQQGTMFVRREAARYAVEACTVWAHQQIWANEQIEFTAGTTDCPFGLNGVAYDVDVISPRCANTPCEVRQLQANVTYPGT